MRDLIVSVVIILVLIGGWLFFDSYSDNTVSSMADDIRRELIPSVESENWSESLAKAESIWDEWCEYKGKALLFLGSDELLEIDQCMAKALKYIQARDVSNSSGELNALAQQLDFLIAREKINAENIF